MGKVDETAELTPPDGVIVVDELISRPAEDDAVIVGGGASPLIIYPSYGLYIANVLPAAFRSTRSSTCLFEYPNSISLLFALSMRSLFPASFSMRYSNSRCAVI